MIFYRITVFLLLVFIGVATQNPNESSNTEHSKQYKEIALVFWIVLSVLVIGIIIIFSVIIHNYGKHRKFKNFITAHSNI